MLVFGYFGIDKFIHPLLWVGWMPLWIDGLLGFPKELWIRVFGTMEIVTALLVASQVKKLQMAGALLASAQILGILTQTGWNDVAARDVVILCSALALFLLLREE